MHKYMYLWRDYSFWPINHVFMKILWKQLSIQFTKEIVSLHVLVCNIYTIFSMGGTVTPMSSIRIFSDRGYRPAAKKLCSAQWLNHLHISLLSYWVNIFNLRYHKCRVIKQNVLNKYIEAFLYCNTELRNNQTTDFPYDGERERERARINWLKKCTLHNLRTWVSRGHGMTTINSSSSLWLCT